MRTLLATALPPEQLTQLLSEAERRGVPLGQLIEAFVSACWDDFVSIEEEREMSTFDNEENQ